MAKIKWTQNFIMNDADLQKFVKTHNVKEITVITRIVGRLKPCESKFAYRITFMMEKGDLINENFPYVYYTVYDNGKN